MKSNHELHYGDALLVLSTLASASVQCCVTSPPYWGLRNYGVDGQIGLEKTPAEYVARLVGVFSEVRRTLRDDGTLWLNLGDSYSNIGKWGGRTSGKHARGLHGGHQTSSQAHGGKIEGVKPKDLLLMPARVALALQADGWYVRSDIIWAKPNPMVESVGDRPTRSHEHLYLLSKSERYLYDAQAVAEPKVDGGGVRNRRDVWTIAPRPYKGAHFAVFPPELPRICILAGSRVGDVVLDPFSGSGTTGAVAAKLGRKFIGIDLNESYRALAEQRIAEGA